MNVFKKRVIALVLAGILALSSLAGIALSGDLAAYADTAVQSTYTDVAKGDWYYSAVDIATNDLKLMKGHGGGVFSPKEPLSREQFVQILFNMSGEETADYKGLVSKFDDVDITAWYAPAIVWAEQNHVTSGMSATTFGTGKAVTREQMAKFMQNYCEQNGLEPVGKDAVDAFADVASVSTWAADAVEWSRKTGLFTGDEYKKFNPSSSITRAETAQVLVNFYYGNSRDTNRAFDLAQIPAYTNSPYAVVNGNVPFFVESELTTSSFESYSDLDALGRCGAAYACVGQDIMPTEERGSIGQIKPSGWHTVKYDIVDGKYLYNRCHLAGYQLTGENANEKNLITGTRYLNIQGMLPFENMVADYVQETNNHVLYRVTPIFEGNNLVASGVLIEAKSVEDYGEGVEFNVYCYNVQPGIGIDYATGESWLIGEVTETQPAEAQNYVLNTSTKKFHYTTCSSISRISEKNKSEYTGTRENLIAQGYEPCGTCKP